MRKRRSTTRHDSSWPETDCFVAFIMDTKCAACRRLAGNLKDREKPIPLLWIFGEPVDEVEEFIGQTGLNGQEVFLLGTPDQPLGTRAAGFVATPTRIAFGAKQYAYDVRVTPEIPDASALQNLCGD